MIYKYITITLITLYVSSLLLIYMTGTLQTQINIHLLYRSWGLGILEELLPSLMVEQDVLLATYTASSGRIEATLVDHEDDVTAIITSTASTTILIITTTATFNTIILLW